MADTLNIQEPKPEFDIGRVINRTFGAIKNNFGSFFTASLIIMGIPTFLINIWPLFFGAGGLDGDSLSSAFAISLIVAGVLGVVVVLIGGVILQGALIFGAIEDFNGRKAPFRECISMAIRYFLPLLGLGILVGLGIVVGLIFFIVPGILIAFGWCIAAPALIVERKGVYDSISRSWELTKGYKRWILLLYIIFMVISLIVGLVIGVFLVFMGDPETIATGGGSASFIITNAVLNGLIQAITAMISATGVAAIYYEIREIKEGIGAESLAAVFD